jgi:hypothetical protein
MAARFIALTFALAVPCWALGAWIDYQALPGLPISALCFLCPGAAALLRVSREQGGEGVRALLARAFDWRAACAHYAFLPVLLLSALIGVLCFAGLRLSGIAVPMPHPSLRSVAALAPVFFIGALGEELGWSGYALDPLQARCGALRAALLLGVAWAAFHLVPLLQVHRSAGWIGAWAVGTVAGRVVMVWLYNHTRRSVLAVTLYHAISNLSWQLFPIHGSYFDPRLDALWLVLIAGTVTALTDRDTLMRRGK